MKCFHCYKIIVGNGKLLSTDGDFVCNQMCYDNYIEERDHFYTEVVHDDKRFANWMGINKGELE